jgi:membrane protein
MHIYGQVGGGILASGLATRALFALLPGLLLMVAAVGFLIRDPAVQEQLYELIADVIPPLRELLEDSLAIIADGAFTFTIVGIVGLVWAASGFFQALEVSFAVILGTRRRRDAVVRSLLGVAGVLVILAAIVLVALVGIVAWNGGDGFVAQILDPVPTRLVWTIATAVVLGLGLCATYRFVPYPQPSWRLVWRPALAVGLAFAIVTQLFSILAPLVAGLASLYGAIAAAFVLLAWLQIGCNLVILGATWLRILEGEAPDPASLPWPVGTADDPRAKADPGTTAADQGG